nr:MAG TPA: hypothetical protein [Caudoviricetes sp.]
MINNFLLYRNLRSYKHLLHLPEILHYNSIFLYPY